MVDADLFSGTAEKLANQLISNGGRDASTGLGRFKVLDLREIDLAALGHENANACWTLAPCVPVPQSCRDAYFLPFIRHGRHGGAAARSGRPFKNPVVMADEGAVLVPKVADDVRRPFIGSSVNGISKAVPAAIAQGYAPFIPIRVETFA